MANKKMLDSQKNKQIVIQNNPLTQQSLVSSQFKPTHLQGLTQQSPLSINQAQLIAPIQQLQQPPFACVNPNPLQGLQGSQIFIRQPSHATSDGQLFIQGSNPALQAMPGAQIYLNNAGGLMLSNHLLPNHTTSNLNGNNMHQPILQTSTSNSTTPTNKLKVIKPASSQQQTNLNH